MAFARKGKQNKKEVQAQEALQIKILNTPEEKVIKASQNSGNTENPIICPNCKKVIGMKIGDVYAIRDGRYISLKGQLCPLCKKHLIKI